MWIQLKMCIDFKCGCQSVFFSLAWVSDDITFFFFMQSAGLPGFPCDTILVQMQLPEPLHWPYSLPGVYCHGLHMWYNCKESLRYAKIRVQKLMFGKMKEMPLRKQEFPKSKHYRWHFPTEMKNHKGSARSQRHRDTYCEECSC